MFTSGTEKNRKRYEKTVAVYLGATAFCVLFGALYECFSHGVYSHYMMYAFVFPLIGGVCPFFLLMKHRQPYPFCAAAGSYHAGIASLTLGSIVTGVLAIYGTQNLLTSVYWIVGAALTVFGAIAYLCMGTLLENAKRSRQDSRA